MVKIHINKNHALLTFVESLGDVSYASKVPKRIFIKRYKSDKELKAFKILHKKISRSAIYKHDNTKSLLEALYLESIKYDNLKDFRSRILSYRTSIRKNDLKMYFDYLKKLMPIYEKLIWNKEYKKLNLKKKELISLMSRHKYNDLIKKIAVFYGVNLKKIGIIDIALYPISNSNNINAYRIKNLETIGVLVNKNNSLKWLLSATIMHEISHTLYFKSDMIKKNIKYKDKKKNTIFLESMATAIGAGWTYKELSHKVNTNLSWYNNRKYDTLAKKIFPKIDIYLSGNKKIDKSFINFVKGNL